MVLDGQGPRDLFPGNGHRSEEPLESLPETEDPDISRVFKKLDRPVLEHPERLSNEELKRLILKAVDEGYRSYGGIRKFAGLPMSYDIEEFLAGMCVDYDLRKETQGDLTAYFRFEEKPLRFWRAGDGRIDAELDWNFPSS
jgi:hypothetical protein